MPSETVCLERAKLFSALFFEVLNDLVGVELSSGSECLVQDVGLIKKSGAWVYVDIQGTQFITVGVHLEDPVVSQLSEMMDETAELTGEKRIDMFDSILKEVMNTCSGRLLSSLRGSSGVLSLRSPGIIYGRVRLPQAPYSLLETNTNIGKIGFVINIDEAKQDLLRLYNKIEVLDVAKSAFIATMSHELRTPLNAIIGFSSILLSKTKNTDTLQKLSLVVNESGVHLLELVDSILDIGHISSGDLAIKKTKMNLSALVRETATQLLVVAESKKLKLTISEDFIEDVTLDGDSNRINQVLINIISNALKFTSKGGVTISLACRSGESLDSVVVKITDTGIGMSSLEMAIIFERFSQADDGSTRLYEGVGLGLALSKELMQLHGGCIEVESTPQEGSCFSLIFPLYVHKPLL